MGQDLTASDTPYDAALVLRRVLDKGPFGRAGRGGARARAGGSAPCWWAAAVQPLRRRGGARGRVGRRRVRSCAFGHTVGRNVAYAILPAEIGPGTTGVQVEVLGQLVDAEVAEDVLYDPLTSGCGA